MKALCWGGTGDMRVEDVPDPNAELACETTGRARRAERINFRFDARRSNYRTGEGERRRISNRRQFSN